MALIQCIECNKERSDTVRKCPHCGHMIKVNKHKVKSKKNKIISIVVVGIVASIFVFLALYTVEQKKVADTVVRLIDDIKLVDENTNEKITIAEVAYENTNAFQKIFITNYSVVDEKRSAYNQFMANKVIDLIEQISSVTLDSGEQIVQAETEYYELSNDQKALVANYEKLTNIRHEYDTLPIALTTENIEDYIKFDFSFDNYDVDISTKFMLVYYEGSADLITQTTAIQDNKFENLVVTLKFNIENTVSEGELNDFWQAPIVKVVIPENGSTTEATGITYESIFVPTGMPRLSDIIGYSVMSVSGSAYKK
jgi:hypothetical protein